VAVASVIGAPAQVATGVRAVDHLGGLLVSRHDPVEVYLDGARVAGDPGSLVLAPHQEIVVAYRAGSASIPASYAFPAGV
jgi:hypothetical protein